ncbi:GspE/PulE family protein [Flavobacteriaceae bacterium M23B6Z8]
MEASGYHIPVELQQLLSPEQAFHYRIVPSESQNGSLCFLTDQHETATLASELAIILGKKVQLSVTDSETLQKYLVSNYRKSVSGASEDLNFTPDFLEKVLRTAKEIGSSDIHFEPYENYCRIRFRIDGKLIEQYRIAIEEYPVIINKIKIRSGLDISEKRLPQDGRITVGEGFDEFDIRVSSLPTLHGEKIVLRILSKDAANVTLEELGFTPEELRRYLECIKKPNGIVLISGPTGSGKTTTLYATLKLLNDSSINIITIEDPIEYTLEGVNQVQLRENIGLDFASALRTFLRQDPNIIMVGEIRDTATANMAIRAALVGRLVLSTIHTNSAWATISRLIDMGIPPFLIASTLNVSVAQRLVRKLCLHCKTKAPVNSSLFPESFRIPDTLTHHYEATGCNQCYHTGYNGRKAVYEIIPITKELIPYIKDHRHEIDAYLAGKKIKTLKTNAVALISSGITSVEEAYALLMD